MRRNTMQRRVVHQAVEQLDHPTAEGIYNRVAEMFPEIGLSTVYRNINVLAQQGEIQRLVVPGQAERYDADPTDHYHYLCDKCGRIYDVPMPYRQSLNEEFAACLGQDVRTHTILLQGVCNACRAAEEKEDFAG